MVNRGPSLILLNFLISVRDLVSVIVIESLLKPFSYYLYNLRLVLNLSKRDKEGKIVVIIFSLSIEYHRIIFVVNLV